MVISTNERTGRKCLCDPLEVVKKISGKAVPLSLKELNDIRLNLFTERNSDGTGYLVLRGKDLYDRFQRRLEDTDIPAICRYIRENPRRITRLDLCYNNITDAGFLHLLKKCLIKGRSSVTNLNIMCNELTWKSVENLTKYSKMIRLRYLRINGNKIGTKGGEILAEFLRSNTTVEYADFSETDQTLTSVACIITALRSDHGANSTLRVLDFSRVVPLFNRYQYETKWLAYHLEYLLERNSTIMELHIQKNELNGHDMEYLVRGLERNTVLKYLDLGFNKLGDYGAELLSCYLRNKPSLVFLNLAGNGISNTGARALSFGLPFSSVRALDVGHNKMTDRGLLDLLNSIKKESFMRFLNIWGNKMTHITCEVIQRMMLSGVLFQHTTDIQIYEVDEVLYAAYYPNPANRNKHLYYCELEYGTAQPMYHIKRNSIPEHKTFKVDCKQRKKLDKTDRNNF